MKSLKVFLLATVVWSLFPASFAMAQPKGFGGNERIVISGPVTVNEGERVDDVIVFHGSADVEGTVNGDLVVFDGPVEVSGTVDGNLVAFKGPITLADTADIRGDVVTRGTLNSAPGAEIGGETRRGDMREFPAQFELFGRIAAWTAFSVSIFVVGLLILLIGPRLNEGLAKTGLNETGPAFAWGLVAFLAIPIATLIAFITLVGIPLGIMLLFGMLFLYPVAYAISAMVAGRKVVAGPEKRFLSFLAGLAVLRLLALVPVVGGITWFLATVFGLGVIAMGIGKARSTPAEPQPAPVSAPSV